MITVRFSEESDRTAVSRLLSSAVQLVTPRRTPSLGGNLSCCVCLWREKGGDSALEHLLNTATAELESPTVWPRKFFPSR